METISLCHTQKHKEICDFQRRKAHQLPRHIYNSVKSISKTTHKHLSMSDAESLIAAILHGDSQYQHWRGITINLTMLDAPQAVETTMRVLMDHLRHWQERNGAPPFWAWVREQGSVLGDHVHILAAAPPRTGHALRRDITRWLRGPTIRGEVLPDTLHIRQTLAVGWLIYVCKTVTPTDAATLFARSGIRIRPEKPGGPVIGQRRGVARCLGPKRQREMQLNRPMPPHPR